MATIKKRFAQAAIALAVVSLAVIAVLGMTAESKPDRFKRINIGDSRATVVSLMGEPDRIDWCDSYISTREAAKHVDKPGQCVREYVYSGFLEQLVVVFDEQDHVSGKHEIVSP
jgi:hypothetical protein